MTTFMISFRIGTEGKKHERYASVVEKIRAESGEEPWDEMTSFFLIGSSGTAELIASNIYSGSEMSPHHDKLLVVNLDDGTFAAKGEIEHPNILESFLKKGTDAPTEFSGL